MTDDLFASLRKVDTGHSTSFASSAEHLEHLDQGACVPGKRQFSAAAHQEHPEHLKLHGSSASGWKLVPGLGDDDPAAAILNAALPDEWRRGLALLNGLMAPRGVAHERWVETVLDAHRFAWRCAARAADMGWSVGSLIGVDARSKERCSLVPDIRAGTFVTLFKDPRGRDAAMIATTTVGGMPAGPHRFHYRQMPDDAQPLWEWAEARQANGGSYAT